MRLGAGAGAVAGALVVGVLAAAVPATAGPDHTKVEFSIGDGTVLLIVRAKARITRAEAVALRPCVSFTFAGGRTQACLRDNDWAMVRMTGGYARSPFLVPFTVERRSPRSLQVVLREADVMLPAGRATGAAWCRNADCRRSERDARVFPMRMRSCTAQGSWLVHSAQRPIGKAVALTFDDGPGAVTGKVLRVLARQRVPATFFQVGRMIVQRPQLLPRIVRSGHVIGNHTWAHPFMTGGDREQITGTQHVIRKLTGFRPCLFRAPYGQNPPDVVALARSLGLTTVNWNVDPGDWRGLSAAQIAATTVAQTRPGSVAVFHDGENHQQMVQALPRLIDELRRRDYRFLTVPELLRLPVSYVATG